MARLGEMGRGAALCPPPASPAPAPTQFPVGRGACWRGGWSAPSWCSPSQGKGEQPGSAWPPCLLGSRGARAGGLHPEEDGVSSKAGGLWGIFVLFPILLVIWTKELVLFGDKTHKTQPVTTRAPRGICLQIVTSGVFMSNSVLAFGGAGEKFFVLRVFQQGCAKKDEECIEMNRPLTVGV